MAKLVTEYALQLNQEELDALKRLLGKLSLSEKQKLGLNERQAEIVSAIYAMLPYPDVDD